MTDVVKLGFGVVVRFDLGIVGGIMKFIEDSCENFVEILGSKEPVPGGGGASALVGAIGMALGNMVGSLTVGKKKYAQVETDIKELMERAYVLQKELLTLVERDAEVFAPLAKAYGLPKDTEEEKAEKDRIMEIVLKKACSVPMEIMDKCCRCIDITLEFAAKGSVLAISDAGCSATILRSALEAASLNVFINTKAMKDREYAECVNSQAKMMLADYTKLADGIFKDVLSKF